MVQLSRQLLERCLGFLANCPEYQPESIIAHLKQICLRTIFQLVEHGYPELLYWCAWIVSSLGAEDELNVPIDTIKTWAEWLDGADYDEHSQRFMFKLPDPSPSSESVGELFYVFRVAIMRDLDKQKCTLV